MRMGSVENGKRVGAVAAGPAKITKLFDCDLLPVVAKSHRETRRSALRGRKLVDDRDAMFPPPESKSREGGQPLFERFVVVSVHCKPLQSDTMAPGKQHANVGWIPCLEKLPGHLGFGRSSSMGALIEK